MSIKNIFIEWIIATACVVLVVLSMASFILEVTKDDGDIIKEFNLG